MRHFWRHIAFTLALVLSASQATAPAVGYVIENQAYADYVPSAGTPQRVQSNTVAVTVGQVSAFTLTAPQERFVAPGGNVSFFHTLTNTGNGADQFSLSLANDSVASSGGAFDFTQWQLFADANGDGIADNNIPLSSSPVLPAGGVFRFVAVAAVPASALTGQRDQLIVSAAGNAAYASSQGFEIGRAHV